MRYVLITLCVLATSWAGWAVGSFTGETYMEIRYPRQPMPAAAADEADALRRRLHRSTLERQHITRDFQDCYDFIDQATTMTIAAWDVSRIPYKNPGANCYDHSKLLQTRLAAAGIESSIFINSGRKHSWVAVWIDATTGKFIRTDNPYSPVLEVRDRDLRVICYK